MFQRWSLEIGKSHQATNLWLLSWVWSGEVDMGRDGRDGRIHAYHQICIHGRSEAHAEKWHNGWQRFMCFMMWPSCHCMHPPHLTCLSRCDPNLHPFFRTHGCGALPGHPCLTTFKAPLSLSRRYADRHRHDTPPTVAPNSKPYLGIDDRR